MREEIEKILEKHFNACWVAFQGLDIPDDNNKYLEAQEATDQILTLLDKSLPKRKPETNADCKWPEHPNNIKCYTAHVPPLKVKEIPENISWNACLQEIKDKLK